MDVKWMSNSLHGNLPHMARKADLIGHYPNDITFIMIWGIDLGTTYSSIGLCTAGKNTEVIADGSSRYSIPSVVFYGEKGEIYVGTTAEHRSVSGANRTVYDSKRLIGHRFDDEPIQDLRMKVEWPFKLERDGNGGIQIRVAGRSPIKPYEVSGEILKHLWNLAKDRVRSPTKDCVITVPANFLDSQRQDTMKAAKYAGLNVVKLINEPTAAAVAYGVMSGSGGKKIVLVFDFGGGTLDVSLLEITGNNFDVKGTAGDPYLGGRDIDNALVEFIMRRERLSIRDNPKKMATLRKAVIEAKIGLSQNEEETIFADYMRGYEALECQLTRKDLERECGHIFAKILEPVREVLKMAQIDRSQVDEILLVGGSSKIPKVKDIVGQFFGKMPYHGVDPEKAVVYGAAIVAASMSSTPGFTSVVVNDICPFDIGVDCTGGEMSPIIKKGSRWGSSNTHNYITMHNYQTGMGFDVYEGQRAVAKYNIHLGHFSISGLPPKLQGEVSVTVKFTLNRNGMLDITATCPGAKTESLQVTRSHSYSTRELNEMQAKAEAMKDQDEREVKLINEFARLEALHANVASFIEHEIAESDRLEDAIGYYRVRRIKDKAKARAKDLKQEDVRLGDLDFWRRKYQRKFREYFSGNFPKFLGG